jgi:integrase
LGDPRSIANSKPMSRVGAIQLGGGQQAPSLRFGSTACARRLSRSEHGIAGADPAAKDAEAVQFEITEPTRDAVSAWIKKSALNSDDFLFPSRIQESPHLSTRQYARIVDSWVQLLGLDTTSYGTHTLRRTKATLIYRRTKNLRAVQLLLGHSKLESTVRYLGIEVDDALEMAEQTDV